MRVESYILRIYRRGRNKVLVGVVEAAASGWQKPFRNISELMDILVAPKRRTTSHAAQETAELPREERKASARSDHIESED
jgi:hypothetical protein